MVIKTRSIQYPFAVDQARGALTEEREYDRYILQLIKQVLLTNPGERINRPDFGCSLRQMLFAPNDDAGTGLTKVYVVQALQQWLGDLIEVDEVSVQSIDTALIVKVEYILRARQERRFLNLELTL